MISKGFANDMLGCMERRGLAPAPELRLLAEPVSGLEEIPIDQLARLWRAVAAALDDEFLGRSAKPMPVGSFRLLCFCVQHAGTLKTAIPRILSYLQILLGNLSGSLAVEGDNARIRLFDSDKPGQAFAQRMYWILVHGLSCWLIGQRIPLRQVDFACEVPTREADYRMFFGAPVRFEVEESCLAFDERYLHLPIRRSDAALKQFLRDAPANILVRYRQDSDLATKIANRLRGFPPDNWPKIGTVSRQFGLSTASLRRHLAHEGQSFQGIKDSIRKHLAIELLADQSLTVMDVTHRIGFSDPSAFHRAFRKWTGETPRGNRSSHGMTTGGC